MNNIHIPDHNFDFTKINFTKPQLVPGSSYFINFSYEDKPLYIRLPDCNSKQGFLKAGKKYYTDLMFSSANIELIEWMEKLELFCQNMIFDNRQEWFEGDMELHDIENYFTSPLKIYRSGRYYLSRVNVPNNLGKPNLKIYNEQEQIISIDDVKNHQKLASIIEIKGIKCTSTCFQVEIHMKQLMVLEDNNIFDSFLLTSKKSSSSVPIVNSNEQKISLIPPIENDINDDNNNDIIETNTIVNYHDNEVKDSIVIENANGNLDDKESVEDVQMDTDSDLNSEQPLEQNKESVNNNLEKNEENTNYNKEISETEELSIEQNEPSVVNNIAVDSNENVIDNVSVGEFSPSENNDLMEVEIPLDDLSMNESVHIKDKNDVYYKMYKDARRKARVARDLANSSYLEAMRIKNLYMLDSDSDTDSENSLDNEFNE